MRRAKRLKPSLFTAGHLNQLEESREQMTTTAIKKTKRRKKNKEEHGSSHLDYAPTEWLCQNSENH